jgi:hypothetical protein
MRMPARWEGSFSSRPLVIGARAPSPVPVASSDGLAWRRNNRDGRGRPRSGFTVDVAKLAPKVFTWL